MISPAIQTQYPVMEQFYTLQGEGRYSGQSAYFIRLGGCDVGCVWCDVKESWDINAHPKQSATDLAARAAKHPGRIAVITGGEPYLHDLTALIGALHAEGFRVHIETSGSAPMSGEADWITLSPKKFKLPLEENLGQAHELKVIAYHRSDFDWARAYEGRVSEKCLLYLQPEWSKREQMQPMIVQFIMEHPRWRLSLQTHKYLDIP